MSVLDVHTGELIHPEQQESGEDASSHQDQTNLNDMLRDR